MRTGLAKRTWFVALLLAFPLACAAPGRASDVGPETPCPEGRQRGPLGGCVRAPRACDQRTSSLSCKGLACRELDGCLVCAPSDTPSPPEPPSCDIECGTDRDCCTRFVCAVAEPATCESGCNVTIPSRCEDDSGCADGARCLQTRTACECGTHFDCFARCPDAGCPAGQL